MRLTRRTRLAGIALVAVGSLTLAACGGDGGEDSSDNVITSFSTEPQNPLVPSNTNEVGGGNIIDLVFAGLVSYTPEGDTEMEVAESIESDDNRTWTITLKDGWTFSDGSPVTAQSFVDAWNYGADPDNAQLGAYFYKPFEGTDDDGNSTGGDTISGLEVTDELSFTATLKEPEAEFPKRLGYSAYYPLPESAFEDMEAFGESPIGNGPYTLESWDHDVEAALVPNGDYDGNRAPQNEGVTFKFYTDPDAAYTDVQSGNLDVLDRVPPSALSSYEEDDQVQPVTEPGSVFMSFTIPSSLAHFGEDEEGKLRRQALSLAIDREQIAEKIFNGANTAATDFSSPLMPGYTEDIPGSEVLEFDVEQAKDLWAQADAIAPFEGTFELSYNSDGPGNKEWVEAAVNQIRTNLEIEAEPKAFATFGEFRELVTNRSIGTAFRTSWQPDYPSVYNYLAPLYGTGAGSNDGDYSNAEFDDLLGQAAAAESEDERAQFLAQAQEILFQDLPAIPLWNQNISAVGAQGVNNLEFNWQNVPVYHNITK
ncbi:ABC transporter substrate-binding protein [Aeromicrobium sp. PE09-221]|uniref:peptide ABC transporter substrate-binding protein n=1 Tax=Aeromicrobium sp. PE09-221 TaxID=1898043 RepID=UPI000B3EC13C|nr:ABC transporter substrate-binding protein [Aeromicrobium sp. PE09-221]OUZ11292.1 ABC transporter substrate-binding protein [Aeromicrobium sp. PE09-221]